MGNLKLMHFKCKSCGSKVSYPKTDKERWKKSGWRCPNCIKVLYDKEYTVNIINGTTVFVALGDNENPCGLGDRTIYEVIKRTYKYNNPDERVYFLEPESDHDSIINGLNPNKIFMSEFYRSDIYKGDKYDYSLIRYNMINNACAYAKDGVYPKLECDIIRPKIYIPEEYVVMHIRNIEKRIERPNPKRNMSKDMIELIYKAIGNNNILIIGNDKVDDDLHNRYNVYDHRNGLTLPEIAYILTHAKLYVGKDSGMVHVAAACDCQMVVYGFNSEKWFPKMDIDRFDAFMGNDNNLFRAISKRL